MRTNAAWLACLVLLGAVACDTREKAPVAPKQRGVSQVSAEPRSLAPEPTPTTAPVRRLEPAAQQAAVAAPQPSTEPPRDFADELTAQLGSAVSCLAPRPNDTAPRSIDIAIVANITPSGRVSRAEIAASMLSDAERACLRQRVESASLAPPFDDAPFRVTATLRFEQAPASTPDKAKPAGAAPTDTEQPAPATP